MGEKDAHSPTRWRAPGLVSPQEEHTLCIRPVAEECHLSAAAAIRPDTFSEFFGSSSTPCLFFLVLTACLAGTRGCGGQGGGGRWPMELARTRVFLRLAASSDTKHLFGRPSSDRGHHYGFHLGHVVFEKQISCLPKMLLEQQQQKKK